MKVAYATYNAAPLPLHPGSDWDKFNVLCVINKCIIWSVFFLHRQFHTHAVLLAVETVPFLFG